MTKDMVFRYLRNLSIIKAVLFIAATSAFGGDFSFIGGEGFASGNRSTPFRVSYDEKFSSNLGYSISYINYWHFRHFEHRNNHIDGLAFQLTAGKDYGNISLKAGLGPFGFFNTINEKKIRYGVDITSLLSADIKLSRAFFWRTEINYAPGFSDGVSTYFILTGPGYRLGRISSKEQSDKADKLKFWIALSTGKTSLNNLGTPKSPLALNFEIGKELSEHTALALSWLHEGRIKVRDGSTFERNGIILQPRLFIKVLEGEGSIGVGPYYETGHKQFKGIFTAFVAHPIGKNWDFRAAWDRIMDGNRGADVLRGGLGYRF
jgi:hypothetical protein